VCGFNGRMEELRKQTSYEGKKILEGSNCGLKEVRKEGWKEGKIHGLLNEGMNGGETKH